MMRQMIAYFRQPRALFQLVVLLVTLGIGVQFYVYVEQAAGTGPIMVARPAGVEGFLPIGALMGWKRFLLTGEWDAVHPAAMVALGWAVLVSFLFRKAFCGWFCPVGTVSEWCWRIGQRIFGKNLKMPVWLDVPLRGLKYILLGFFLWIILGMSVEQIAGFMDSPYYRLSDAKMLHFFTKMTWLTAGVLAVLAALSLVFKNFWCRYLCPYGALLGLVSMVSPTHIQRCDETCTQCGRCDRACPSHLPVSKKEFIRSAECTGCMTCTTVCPANKGLLPPSVPPHAGGRQQTLTLTTKGVSPRFWTPGKLAVVLAVFFLLTVYLASAAGHWRGSVSDEEFRVRLRGIDSYTHPR